MIFIYLFCEKMLFFLKYLNISSTLYNILNIFY